jgi:hypothetical protein
VPDFSESIIIDIEADADAVKSAASLPGDPLKGPTMSRCYAELNAKPGPGDVPASTMRAVPVIGRELPHLTPVECQAREYAAYTARANYERQVLDWQNDQELRNERRNEAKLDAITNAIAATENELENAPTSRASAYDSGDFQNAAAWTRHIEQKEGELGRLQSGLDAWDQAEAAQQNAPRRQTLDDVIETHGVGTVEKDLLRRHPEFLQSEPGITRLRGAAMNATSRDLARGSTEFVRDVETQLFGPQPQADQRPQLQRVTLSADQRAFYHRLGLSDQQAGREVLKLQNLKRQGYYQNEG